MSVWITISKPQSAWILDNIEEVNYYFFFLRLLLSGQEEIMKSVFSLWYGKGNECYWYENKWRQWKSLTYEELWSLVQCALKVRIRLTNYFSCLVSRWILLKFSWIAQARESMFLFMLYCICGDVFKVNQSLPGCLLRSYWSENK